MDMPIAAPSFLKTRTFWAEHREATLNWLALGLLLAAWNASDNDVSRTLRERPPALRGYAYVSVRATLRSTANHP
jgi:hypothetical protein